MLHKNCEGNKMLKDTQEKKLYCEHVTSLVPSLVWSGLVWSGLDWTRLDWTGLVLKRAWFRSGLD